MVKSKVGAEPKEKRIKHYYDEAEAFHIGVSRDEWCCYRSKRFPFVAIGGYFIDFGDWWAKKCSTELLEKYWDNYAYGTNGYKDHVFGVVDRKRKIAVIKYDCRYRWNLEKALPDDFIIYYVMSFPIFNITAPRNRKTLLKEYAKYLINQYMSNHYQEFKVLNTRSKHLYEDSAYNAIRKDVISKLKELSNKVPTKTSLFDKDDIFVSYNGKKVKYPTIDDILNDKLFTEEQKEYFAKCKFYTKYIYNKPNNYTWKDVENNWNKLVDDELLWQDDIAKKAEENTKALYERFKECKAKVTKNLQAKIKEFVNGFGAKNVVDYWRKNDLKYNTIAYKDCYIKNDYIQWYDSYYTLNNHFDNIQLKLKGDYVITSKGVSVPLNLAIKLFNKLYVKYFIDKTTDSVVFCNNINICCYKVRFIRYKEKVKDNGEPLGYKEWCIQIGCHALWLDDIEDFIKYYKLQDKLSFPLDKTTEECRNNNLIHLITDKND